MFRTRSLTGARFCRIDATTMAAAETPPISIASESNARTVRDFRTRGVVRAGGVMGGGASGDPTGVGSEDGPAPRPALPGSWSKPARGGTGEPFEGRAPPISFARLHLPRRTIQFGFSHVRAGYCRVGASCQLARGRLEASRRVEWDRFRLRRHRRGSKRCGRSSSLGVLFSVIPQPIRPRPSPALSGCRRSGRV